DRLHRCGYLLEQDTWITACADGHPHNGSRGLPKRNIDFGDIRLPWTLIAHVVEHAYDFACDLRTPLHRHSIQLPDRNLLRDRISARQVASHECLIDDGHRSASRNVLVSEGAPSVDTNSKRLEISRGDDVLRHDITRPKLDRRPTCNAER